MNHEANQEANRPSAQETKRARDELLPKILDFTKRLHLFSWGLQNYYTDVYLTSDSSRSLEIMNYNNHKYRAYSDLEALQNEIEAFRKQYDENSGEINNASKSLDAIVNILDKSCTIVEGTYVLKSASRDLKSLKYDKAVDKLASLHSKLDKIEFQGDLGTALRNFRSISETQLTVVQAQLSVEWSNLFRWNFNRTLDTLIFSMTVYQNDPELLHTVLTALYKADQIMVDLQRFSEFFISDVLPNIIKYNCEIFIEDHLGTLVFTITILMYEKSPPSIPTTFNNLTAVFEFLESTMGKKLEPEKKFMECFGNCNRDAFFSKIINNCIKSNLPCCENSYQAYKEIVVELATFNKFLVDLNYVEERESPLKKYIDHTDLLLYHTTCNKMLREARELMKECLSQKTVTVGALADTEDDSFLDVTQKRFKYNLNTPIFFPKCVVSQHVRDIGALIAKYLEVSAQLPMEFGSELVLYIKHIAVMYETAVPEKNAARLKKNALEIALIFNNCNYLAHSLIGPPWKTVLPKNLADSLNTTLMPHIYDLRVVGMEILSLYLRSKREIFASRIAGVNSDPVHEWNEDAFEVFNRDVNYCLSCLVELQEAWREVLPTRMWEQAAGSLAGAVCDAMTKYVLKRIADTTEPMVYMLAECFLYAADEIKALFSTSLPMDVRVKGWARFTQVPKLFKAQLLEISNMWNEDATLNRHFSCEEVRVIIKMRFPNSKCRLKVLNEVQ